MSTSRMWSLDSQKLYQEIWLKDTDILSKETIDYRDTLFIHLHGAIWTGKNFLPLIENENYFDNNTFHIALNMWDVKPSGKNFLDDMRDNITQKIWNIIQYKGKSLHEGKIILHGNSFWWQIALELANVFHNDIDGLVLNCSSWFWENLKNRFGSIFELFGKITKQSNLEEQKKEMKNIIHAFIDIQKDKIPDFLVDDALDLWFLMNSENNKYTSTNKIQFMKFKAIAETFDKKIDIWAKVLNATKKRSFSMLYRELKAFIENKMLLANIRKYNVANLHQRSNIYDKPVLIIWWDKDKVTPPSVIHRQGNISNTKPIIMEGVWHTPHIEKPATFVSVLNDRSNANQLY